MQHVFVRREPHTFPNGDVFFVVASMPPDRSVMTWRTPESHEEVFRELANRLDDYNFLDPKVLRDLESELDRAVRATDRIFNWRTAVGYEYRLLKPPRKPDISVLCNESDDLPPDIHRDDFSRRYVADKYATCYIENSEIASICYANNSAIGIETKPKYRRRGLGKACLARIVGQMMKAGSRIGYGTGYENVASRRTAEAVGFKLNEYMYWIEITADRKEYLPPDLQKILGQR